jgi:hypothetical protein
VFTIKSRTQSEHFGIGHCEVIVEIDVKYWTKLRSKGHLGQLYGVDISNAVYSIYGVPAWNPTVGDRARAKNGIKTIRLEYTYDPAKAIKPRLRLVAS